LGQFVRRPLYVTGLVSSILALGSFYLLYTAFVSPVAAANEQTRAALLKQQAENAAAQEIERSEPQFRAEFARVIQLYADAQPLLPGDTEVGNVLAQVQEAATRNGVLLTGLNASKEGVKSPALDKVYERELPALVVGAHPQVVKFFYDVARLPRIILIRDFAVTSLRQRVAVNFTLTAYNAPPPAETPALPEEFNRLIQEAQRAQAR
jgi:Tfp pilus assembly protein PilO